MVILPCVLFYNNHLVSRECKNEGMKNMGAGVRGVFH